MGRFLGLILTVISLVFSFTFTESSLAAFSPNGLPLKNLGGYGTTISGVSIPATDTSFFTIYAGLGGGTATANQFTPFYKNGAAYQVGANKTAYCSHLVAASSGVTQYFQLVSATAAFAVNAAAITGGVHQCGAASAYCMKTDVTANVNSMYNNTYEFGQNTFPGVQYKAGASENYTFSMICKEQ